MAAVLTLRKIPILPILSGLMRGGALHQECAFNMLLEMQELRCDCCASVSPQGQIINELNLSDRNECSVSETVYAG